MKKLFAIVAVVATLVGCATTPKQEETPREFDKFNSVVYEFNVRQATEEGTFAAAEAYLPELKEMGVDIVWLMPISPIGEDGRKGTLGSYYSIINYKEINPEFGTMEDFDKFLATAHDLGLKVIIDWVANHTSRDADWWKEGKKDWYVMDEKTGLPIVEYDWTDIAKLNYNNYEMREAMIDALKFWIEKGVDGYRCDVAMNVPADFWAEAWKQVREINPDVYLLAEGEEQWLHEAGFEATYAWELHHIFNAMAKGGSETKNVAGDGTIKTDAKTVADLKEYLARDDEKYPAPAMRLMFTSNHDENSWAGTEFERMGDAHKTFAALTFVLPKSQPLIYTGQEIGLNRRLQFFEKDSVKELVDLEFVYTDGTTEKPRKVGSVPVQRNYRTNLYGKLLTSEVDINVEIEEEFDGEFDNEGYFVVETNAEGKPAAVVVKSAKGMATIAAKINEGKLPSNTNVALEGDIDLADFAEVMRSAAVVSNWTPIGTSENPFTGTFDGKGYTIKNLALVEAEAKEGKAYIGFFGYAKDATIKNVTFENVYINIPCLDIDHSQGHIGAVAGSLEGKSTIENVTVKGDIFVEATTTANGASRVAVVAGGNSYGNVTIKNVHVNANEGSYLKANNNVGAIAGQLQGKTVYENCSSNIDVTGTKFFAGGIVGLAGTNDTFTNCHTTGDITITAGREGKANDQYRVGGIAGGWADGKTNTCTLTDCTYTGKVSGTNSDGSVADPLDYWGYVGRGYTLGNCAGSKVVIDGTEFVQKYDNVYGVYTINGLTPVATADELVAALEANEGVYFLNNIKIDPASMSNAYGTTGINVKNGQTIDGNGHTLDIKGAGGTWDSGINTTGGLIKNLTVTGSFRGIFVNHNSTHSEKVVLENVTIGGNGTVYTISCDQGLYQGIEATNCTFNGWTSFAKDAGGAKFVNCSFGEGSGYKYCRPYSNTEFVNCTFCPGYAVDTTCATVTFTNCTWEE